MKYLFICHDSNMVISFREDLITYFLKQGDKIAVLCSDDKRKCDIENLGADFYSTHFTNRSLNPFCLLKTICKIKKTISHIKPDAVFTFQITPNIAGTLAAKKCGISNVFSMVEGLGDPFQPTNFLQKIIRSIVIILYRKSFKNVKKVFFLNNDDEREFIERRIIKHDKSVVIHGIGINTEKYKYCPEISNDKNVLCIARLIPNKGILDYCNLARLVRKTNTDINFYLYGAESKLCKKDIEEYINDGSIIYNGFVTDIIPAYRNCRAYLSTSYREGFPRTLLESMAVGRPIIATNVVGNKDAIIQNENGYLFNCHDIEGMAKKIIDFINDDDALRELGRKARKICEEKYDCRIINQNIYSIIKSNIS